MGNSDDVVKVVICGGREFVDVSLARETLKDLVWRRGPFATLRDGPIKILHGGARGADKVCDFVARDLGISRESFPAVWKDLSFPDARIKKNRDGTLYDANAGFRRNQEMIDAGPDVVIAFPGHRGTEDTCRRAEKKNIRVVKIGDDET